MNDLTQTYNGYMMGNEHQVWKSCDEEKSDTLLEGIIRPQE